MMVGRHPAEWGGDGCFQTKQYEGQDRPALAFDDPGPRPRDGCARVAASSAGNSGSRETRLGYGHPEPEPMERLMLSFFDLLIIVIVVAAVPLLLRAGR